MKNIEFKPQKKSRKSKAVKIVFFVLIIFVVSGISSILADKYLFPWLATRSWLQNQKFFKKGMEDVMVINKTEQVIVSESQTVSGFTEKSASSVVEIVARQKGAKSSAVGQIQSASGVIVAADGLIMGYNGNFFDGKDSEYKVFTQDGKSFDATVTARDAFSDIVLLKLAGAENLPVAEFISPDDIRVGMKTAVVSRSGFNSEISLRLGIASEWAKADSIAGPLASSEKLQGVLLFDPSAKDNSGGNISGAAAVDYNGNVIGILGEKKEDSTKKFFIVPVNHLQYVIDQYFGKGKIERASLGVYYVPLTKETAYFTENGIDRGALVYSPSGQQGLAVIAGSAADKAGIRIGDIILNINGEEVNPDQNLAYLISKYKPNDKIDLKISRDGEEMNISVTLG